MKKALLLSALIATTASFAGTTGFIKGSFEESAKSKKVFVGNNDTKKIEIKDVFGGANISFATEGEVKINDSGLSFGGKLVTDNLFGKAITSALSKDDSNVWAKYEFAKIGEVSPSIKGQYNFDNSITTTLEAKAKLNNVNITGTLESGMSFSDNSSLTKIKDAKLYVLGKVAADSKVSDNLKVGGEVSVKYRTNKKDYIKGKTIEEFVDSNKKTIDEEYSKKISEISGKTDDSDNLLNKEKLISNTVALGYDATEMDGYLVGKHFVDAEYTGLKDTTLYGKFALNHVHSNKDIKDEKNYTKSLILNPELTLKGTYKGFENATLEAEVVSGLKKYSTVEVKDAKESKVEDADLKEYYVNPTVSGKYVYKVNDKLTMTPSLTIVSKNAFYNHKLEDEQNPKQKHDVTTSLHMLTVEPKLGVEYKVNENLTLNGSVSVPTNFTGYTYYELVSSKKDSTKDSVKKVSSFGFHNVSGKLKGEVKYTW